MSYFDIRRTSPKNFQKNLFYDGRDDLRMPDLVEPNFLAGGDTQIQNAPVHVGPAVVHPHDNAAAVIDTHHLELGTKRQALVRTRKIVLVENFATRRLLAVKTGAIVTCLALDFQADFGLLARSILLFGEPHVSLARGYLRIARSAPREQEREAQKHT